MTIRVKVTNENRGGTHNLRVHRCIFSDSGISAEDGVIIKPGESHDFTIWGQDVRLAIEEEYDPADLFTKPIPLTKETE